MAVFDVVDLNGPTVTTRGGPYGEQNVVGSVDTAALAQQLEQLRSDLGNALDKTDGAVALSSIVVKLTIGAEGKIAFIAKGSVEASIEVTFSRGALPS